MPDRAVLFIDGNNWYHSLRAAGVDDLGRLSYVSVSQKLVGPREWVGTRYYIGRVRQGDNPQLYADQRRFLKGPSTWLSSMRPGTGHLPHPERDGGLPWGDEVERIVRQVAYASRGSIPAPGRLLYIAPGTKTCVAH